MSEKTKSTYFNDVMIVWVTGAYQFRSIRGATGPSLIGCKKSKQPQCFPAHLTRHERGG